MLWSFAVDAFAIVAVPVADQKLRIGASDAYGCTWAAAENRLYRIEGESAKLVQTFKGSIHLYSPDLMTLAGQSASKAHLSPSRELWVADMGHELWRVDTDLWPSNPAAALQSIAKFTKSEEPRLGADADGVVFTTGESIKRILPGGRGIIELGKTPGPVGLFRVDQTLYAYGDSKWWIVRRDRIEPGRSSRTWSLHGETYDLSPLGIFRIEGPRRIQVVPFSQPVSVVYEREIGPFGQPVSAQNSIWWCSFDELFQFDGRSVSRFRFDPKILGGSTAYVRLIGEHYWFVMDGWVYLLSDGVAHLVEMPHPRDLGESHGVAWITTDEAIYRYVNGLEHVRDSSRSILLDAIIEANGRCWMIRKDGLYVADGRELKLVVSNPDIDDGSFIGNHVWFNAGGRTFRIDEGVDITADVVNAPSSWRSIADAFLPKGMVVSGPITVRPHYRDKSGRDPYGKDVPKQFFAVMKSSRPEFEQAVKNHEFIDARNASIDVGVGSPTIWMDIHDISGSTVDLHQDIRVAPGPALASAAVWSGWALLFAFIFIAAPFSDAANRLVMNPWLRRYATFGAIPLVLSVLPAARRHLLRRYRRELHNALSDEAKRFVLPSDDMSLDRTLRLLEAQRRVVLIGPSGIGKTAYLRFVAASVSATGTWTPVLVPLARHHGREIEDVIFEQLCVYGRMDDTDRQLLSWFIDEGGFLFLLDGLNEIDTAYRDRVARFVDRHWRRNLVFMTSQEDYEEFRAATKMKYAPLGDDQIVEFLKSRLPMTSEAVLEEVRSARDLYCIPQNLELLIGLLRDGGQIPTTQLALYSRVLEPVMTQWDSAGSLNYRDIICRRAFTMLATKESVISELPAGLLEPLEERKFVIRRDKELYFAHDLIRAYFAAQHLRGTWRDVLQDETMKPDRDWLTAMELLTQSLLPEDARDLLFTLLRRNPSLAGATYRKVAWAANTDWAAEFKQRYADAILQTA